MSKILVVDDDDSNRSLLGHLLGISNNELLLAATATEALQLAHPTIDIALVDMHLPDGIGTDIVKVLRANSNTTFIIIATMDDSPETIQKAYQSGCDMFLVKPYNIPEMTTLLAQVRRGKLWILDRHGQREYHGKI